MENVPFAFHSSVCRMFREPHQLEFRCRAWHAAAKEVWKNRIRLTIHICHNNGVWMYDLKVFPQDDELPSSNITIEELRRLDRRHLQVAVIVFTHSTMDKSPKSLDEIFEIMDFTYRFINRSSFFATERSVGRYPEDVLSRMLAFYHNAEFKILTIHENHQLVESFLIRQLQSSEVLERVSISWNRYSDGVRVAVEDFALSKNFAYLFIGYDALAVDKTFLERFFERTVEANTKCEVNIPISFNASELHIHGADSSWENGRGRVTWKRDDGVNFEVEFSRSNAEITVQRGE